MISPKITKFIADHQELARKIQRLQQAGQEVVFTNGCFDVLHVGHIRCLQAARQLGDVLVVAVNSDDSVRQAKGAGRPYVPEMERIEILAAIVYVDFLTLFHAPTVDELLLLLKPAIHAKGTDYTLQTVPERDTVLSYGGRLAIVGDPKDHSSTLMLQKLPR